MAWFLPAAGGAIAAGLARAAASVAVRRLVVGTAIYFGGQYIVREAISQTEITMKEAFTAGGRVSEAANEQITKVTRNLWIPAVAGFIIVSSMRR